MGHAVAVADAPASCFAAELIEAYPDAKVILNYRKDIDAWHRSVIGTLAEGHAKWIFGFLATFDKECFWSWHLYLHYLWSGLFRSLDGKTDTGMKRLGKWAYRCELPHRRSNHFFFCGSSHANRSSTAHYNMVRGMVPKERMLEWCVEDGWEPLCEFLGKEVPDEEFPKVNTGAGFDGQEKKLIKRWMTGALKNLALVVGSVGAVGVGVAYAYAYHRR
jgi:hypothetical protein